MCCLALYKQKKSKRFKTSRSEDQQRDLAYCLSQINYSEKALKKLVEMYPYYKERLCDPAVMSHMEFIQKKARKFAKPEMKQLIESFSAKLSMKEGELETGGTTQENGDGDQKTISKSKPKAKPRPKRRTTRRRAAARKKKEWDVSDTESSVEELSEDSS